jgi:hypothetical protein
MFLNRKRDGEDGDYDKDDGPSRIDPSGRAWSFIAHYR